MCGWACENANCGNAALLNDQAALISPRSPRQLSRCPIFAFNEPIKQTDRSTVPSNHAANRVRFDRITHGRARAVRLTYATFAIKPVFAESFPINGGLGETFGTAEPFVTPS